MRREPLSDRIAAWIKKRPFKVAFGVALIVWVVVALLLWMIFPRLVTVLAAADLPGVVGFCLAQPGQCGPSEADGVEAFTFQEVLATLLAYGSAAPMPA